MQGPSVMGLSQVTLIFSGSQVPIVSTVWETEPGMEDSKRQRMILCITRIKDYKELFFLKAMHEDMGKGQAFISGMPGAHALPRVGRRELRVFQEI